MKFNSDLIAILQNFSSINPSMVFKKGHTVSTISPMKSIVAKATSPVEFESTFGIFALGQFLNTLSLFDDPELTPQVRLMLIEGSKNGEEVTFPFSEPALIIQPPEKDIVFPEADVTFKLANDTLKQALKAASVIGSSQLAITGDGTTVRLEGIDVKNPSSNSYKIIVGETTKKFRVIYQLENLLVMPRDYDVQISSKGLSHFKATDIEYWIAIDAKSTFEA